ncbi:MAG: peptide deformylase [bacterium]
MSRALTLYPDEDLERVCRPVEDPADWSSLIEDMRRILYEYDGVGLAAPQVGEDVQIFVLCLDVEKQIEEVYLNPEIIDIQDEEPVTEGCLSFPNIDVEIRRGTKVQFKALTPGGEQIERTVEGLQAQCVQHELDHLQGKTILDRCDFSEKMKINDQLNELKNGNIPDPLPEKQPG